jgi:hypothetical protein
MTITNVEADDVVHPCSDSPRSSDEYQPAKEESLLKSEEEVMDASDDEPVKEREDQEAAQGESASRLRG